METPKPLEEKRGRTREEIISALNLTVHRSADMPAELRMQILDSQPTAEELAKDLWNDP